MRTQINNIIKWVDSNIISSEHWDWILPALICVPLMITSIILLIFSIRLFFNN